MDYDMRVRVVILCLLLPFLLVHLLFLYKESGLDSAPSPSTRAEGDPMKYVDAGGGTVGRKALSDAVAPSSHGEVGEDWAGEQWGRRELLARSCRLVSGRRRPLRALWGTKEGHRHLHHLLVDDQHQALYCYVPKVACTNWKRVWMLLTGRSNATRPQDIPSHVPHQTGSLRRLADSSFSMEDIRIRLETYKKFLFVRDPMERLVSAFRNKLEKETNSSSTFRKVFGVEILRQFRKQPERVSLSGNGVTFSEFVRFLLDKKVRRRENLNEHWAPFTELCHPCIIPYDFIGHYETLHQDAENILREIGAPENLHFPPLVPSVTRSLVPQYLRTLLPSEQRRLYSMYQPDFVLFQYRTPAIRNISALVIG